MDVKKLSSDGDEQDWAHDILQRLVSIAEEHFKDFYIAVGDGNQYWIESNSQIWAESICKRYIIEQELRMKRHISDRIKREEDE